MKLIDTLENHRPVENRFLCKVEGQPDIWAQPRAIMAVCSTRHEFMHRDNCQSSSMSE